MAQSEDRLPADHPVRARAGRTPKRRAPVDALNKPLSIPAQVAATLSTRIMSGQIAPATHLKGPELAAEFGVSRVTIHDALRLLERHGLVQIEERRGAFVADPGHSELTEILEIRAVLFGLAARLACVAADDAFIAEFVAGVKRQRQLAKDPATTPQDYGAASIVLQRALAGVAGNLRLVEMLDELSNRSIWRLVFRDGPLDHTEVNRRVQSARIWGELADALARREGLVAEEVAKKLIHASRDFIVAGMKRPPSRPAP